MKLHASHWCWLVVGAQRSMLALSFCRAFMLVLVINVDWGSQGLSLPNPSRFASERLWGAAITGSTWSAVVCGLVVDDWQYEGIPALISFSCSLYCHCQSLVYNFCVRPAIYVCCCHGVGSWGCIHLCWYQFDHCSAHVWRTSGRKTCWRRDLLRHGCISDWGAEVSDDGWAA